MQQREDLLNYRAGLAPAATYNINRKKKTDKVIEPLQFFAKPKARKMASAEDIAKSLDRGLLRCQATFALTGQK